MRDPRRDCVKFSFLSSFESQSLLLELLERRQADVKMGSIDKFRVTAAALLLVAIED